MARMKYQALCFITFLPWNFQFGITKVRLVSDGCGSQNKNNITLGMAISWLARTPAQIDSVELLLPVRGHSFVPCDRLFGRIEKELKSNNTIIGPSGFHEIFKNHCFAVYEFGND